MASTIQHGKLHINYIVTQSCTTLAFLHQIMQIKGITLVQQNPKIK